MEMKKIACAVLVAAASATAAFAAEAPAPSPTSASFAVAPAVGAVLGASAMDSRFDISGDESKVFELIEDLKSNSTDVQRAATAELRLLARHMENRMVIANCGAISLLVGLLHSTDPKTQENAVTALLNLSLSDNKIAIANANAIDPLIHVLKTGNPEAQENSAATLLSLSVTEENKLQIGRSGAIGPLVELLANGTLRGKKDAVSALYNLSTLRDNKLRIARALLNCFQNQGYLHSGRSTFKKKAPKAIKEIKKFAQKAMGTTDVRVDVKLNKHIWSRGIRSVPRRVRVRIARKRNDEEDAKEELFSLVTVAEVSQEGFKGLGTKVVDEAD
ncbi:unnamed protein product [Musa banksii]